MYFIFVRLHLQNLNFQGQQVIIQNKYKVQFPEYGVLSFYFYRYKYFITYTLNLNFWANNCTDEIIIQLQDRVDWENIVYYFSNEILKLFYHKINWCTYLEDRYLEPEFLFENIPGVLHKIQFLRNIRVTSDLQEYFKAWGKSCSFNFETVENK